MILELNPFKWGRKPYDYGAQHSFIAALSAGSPAMPHNPNAPQPQETHTMNLFSLIFALVPALVKGIQSIHGDSIAGETKAQMAQDALKQAVTAAGTVLTGSNLQYSEIAGAVAQVAIDQTVSIAKASGVYGKWTAIANAAQQDASIAPQVVAGIQSVNAPAPTTPAAPGA